MSLEPDDLVVAPRPPVGPVSLAIYASGLRCMFTYVVLPGLAPVLGAFSVLTLPIVLALYALGATCSVRAVVQCARAGRVLGAVGASLLLTLNLLGAVVLAR